MPTVLSMCHGGIERAATRVLIERAHGRTSSKVRSDIGAICPGLWHVTQDRCRMGATSFVKVTPPFPCFCCAARGVENSARPATRPGTRKRVRTANLQSGQDFRVYTDIRRAGAVFSKSSLK